MTQITLSVYAEIKNSENLGINNNIENINTENNQKKVDELTKWDYLVITCSSAIILTMIISYLSIIARINTENCSPSNMGMSPQYHYKKKISIVNKYFPLFCLVIIGMFLILSALLFFCRSFFTNTELKLKTFLIILLIMFILSIIVFIIFLITQILFYKIRQKFQILLQEEQLK